MDAAPEIPAEQLQIMEAWWAAYYKRHGCLHCHQDTQPHCACGMCTRCYNRIVERLTQIVKEIREGE